MHYERVSLDEGNRYYYRIYFGIYVRVSSNLYPLPFSGPNRTPEHPSLVCPYARFLGGRQKEAKALASHVAAHTTCSNLDRVYEGLLHGD